MRSRLTAMALAALTATVLLAGCGDDGEDVRTGSPDSGGDGSAAAVRAGGADGGLFIEVEHLGPFSTPGDDARRVPSAVVYADGTVFAPGVITLAYPGPAVLPLYIGQVDQETIDALLAEVVAAGVLDEPFDAGDAADLPATDAPLTRVTVVVDGEEHVVEAYALPAPGDPLSTDEEPSGLTDEERENRARLAELVAAVSEATAAADELYDPERYAVTALPLEADPEVAPNELTWPASLPEPAAGECVAVSGEGAGVLEALLPEATEITRWAVADRAVSLAIRPLLPHEPGCPERGG